MRSLFLLFVALVGFGSAFTQAQDKAKDKKEDDKPFLLVVPPTGGKEVKLVDWRFTQGTRRLDLDGDAPKEPKSKTPAGAEYLEFREEKSTTYKNGIYTYIPLASMRKLEYDRANGKVAAVAINGDGAEATLVGSTKAVSNHITIEAEALLDGLGAATIKFNGGGVNKGLQSVTFPAPKPAEKVKGGPAVITADDKEKTKHTVHDVRPVYLVEGQYRVMPYVMFKKTVKVNMDKLVGLKYVPPVDKKGSSDYEVTLKDGAKHTLSILTTVELEKKKTMTFVGLVGRVPVGYKLFMVDAIYEYSAGAPKEKLDARLDTPSTAVR